MAPLLGDDDDDDDDDDDGGGGGGGDDDDDDDDDDDYLVKRLNDVTSLIPSALNGPRVRSAPGPRLRRIKVRIPTAAGQPVRGSVCLCSLCVHVTFCPSGLFAPALDPSACVA